MSARLDAAVAELVAALREEIRATAAAAPPALLSIDQAAERLGIGRTTLYGAIGREAVRSVKVGGRRLIPADELARVAAGKVQL